MGSFITLLALKMDKFVIHLTNTYNFLLPHKQNFWEIFLCNLNYISQSFIPMSSTCKLKYCNGSIELSVCLSKKNKKCFKWGLHLYFHFSLNINIYKFLYDLNTYYNNLFKQKKLSIYFYVYCFNLFLKIQQKKFKVEHRI